MIWIATALLMGCGPDRAADTAEPFHYFETNGQLASERWFQDVPSDGELTQEFEIGGGTTSFLVSASHDRGFPVVQRVIAPDGTVVVNGREWVSSDETLSTGFVWAKKTTAFGWPTRAVDPELTPGTWTVEWAVTQSDGAPSDGTVELSVVRKADPKPNQGTLTVRVVFADGMEDPVTTAAVDGALIQMVDWFAGVGITLVHTQHSSQLADSGALGDELVPVVEDVAELGDLVLIVQDSLEQGVLGASPGVPGSVHATRYHYSGLSMSVLGGDDGVYTDNEVSMVAQTAAHELGHYMGLNHVVEVGYTEFDALDDTPRCSDWTGCEMLMDHNLMYPHVNCLNDGSCIVNNELTADQVAVLHQSVFVR